MFTLRTWCLKEIRQKLNITAISEKKMKLMSKHIRSIFPELLTFLLRVGDFC